MKNIPLIKKKRFSMHLSYHDLLNIEHRIGIGSGNQVLSNYVIHDICSTSRNRMSIHKDNFTKCYFPADDLYRRQFCACVHILKFFFYFLIFTNSLETFIFSRGKFFFLDLLSDTIICQGT